MNCNLNLLRRITIGAALGAICVLGAIATEAGERALPKPSFNAEGELIRPDFRPVVCNSSVGNNPGPPAKVESHMWPLSGSSR